MLTIYVSVLKQEKKLDKYLSTSMSKKKRTNSIKIRNQAFLYVGCMYMTWLFGSVFRMMQFAGKKPPPAIIVLFVLFFPLQVISYDAFRASMGNPSHKCDTFFMDRASLIC